MNETELAMCATLEIAQYRRALLLAPKQEPPKDKRRRKPEDRPAPTHAISERLTGSERGLELLMRKLAVHGIVTGIRGPRGGHRLAREESEITLRDIHDAVGNPDTIGHLGLLAPDIQSHVQWVIGIAQRASLNHLERWTVARALDFIEGKSNKEPSWSSVLADAHGRDNEIDF